jgi:hypothetical protein
MPSTRILVLALATLPLACRAVASDGPVRGVADAAPSDLADATPGLDDAYSLPQTPCSPLVAAPTTLGTIVGVAEDTSGVLYVDSSNGIFVSSGATLNRQYVNGSGQSGDDFLFTFEPPGDDGTGARNLIVVETGGVASAMSLGPPGSKSFSGGTPLTLVAPSTVSRMTIVNTPNVIDYVADVANGDILLATQSMNNDTPPPSNGGFSVFYGPPAAVAERTVTAFEETLSNDGTMTFLVGGTLYTLAFEAVDAPDSGPLGVFTLESLTPEGGAPLAVTLRSPTPTMLPGGLSFFCSP